MDARPDQRHNAQQHDQAIVEAPRDDRTNHVNSNSPRGTSGARKGQSLHTTFPQTSIILGPTTEPHPTRAEVSVHDPRPNSNIDP